MPMLAGEGLHLLCLGVRNSKRIGPALASPLMVDVEHDLRRGLAVLAEHLLQHVHDELHRGDVIVEQQHAEHIGRFVCHASTSASARAIIFGIRRIGGRPRLRPPALSAPIRSLYRESRKYLSAMVAARRRSPWSVA